MLFVTIFINGFIRDIERYVGGINAVVDCGFRESGKAIRKDTP